MKSKTNESRKTRAHNGQRLAPCPGSAAALRLEISRLEEECKRLKRMARRPHEPIAGIGGTVQRLRHKKELSITQLANASKVSKGQISRLERVENANANLDTLERLATALGLKLSELILAYESEKPQNDGSERPIPGGKL